ncbi:MAG TPA: gamma-glutamyltransferase family protein [Gemmatimonadaceae bacterium]|nr:gamma-glutamyltransferase family protein [Gemmatimonadaceae bacterium]
MTIANSALLDAQRASAAPPPIRPPTMAGRSPVYAPNGIAATSQPLATTAAIMTMERGGNAIDAAVAAAAVLSVVEPMMTGIGGDMFAVVWSAKDKRLYALNASGRAGALMTREELLKRGRTTRVQRGPESVTVPGALAGWQALLDRFGTMKLAQVLEPAIGYADGGFPVTPVISRDWGNANALMRDPGMKATFLLDSTRVPKAGDWFRNPTYATTLRAIAKSGPDYLYKGPLGEKIVNFLHEKGGFLTLDDLKNNAPTWVTPLSVLFHGYRVWEMPPNNQGIATLEMLRILEPYDLKAMGQNSAPYLHTLIEAKKLAYADLAQYDGDADHLTVQPSYLLSDPFIAERRSHIDPNHAMAHTDPGPERTSSETIYLTVADKDGNMVSFINSQFDEWGSEISAPGTGFSLQDRGLGFTLEPNLPNTVAPGKRPFHTLIPGFVTKPGPVPSPDGFGDEPYMSFGLMGGAMQAQGHAQFLINLLVFGMNVQQAMDAGRFRHNAGLEVEVEPAIPDSVVAALRKLGHTIVFGPPGDFGGSQAIIKLTKGYVAGSDPRKDGHAAGY